MSEYQKSVNDVDEDNIDLIKINQLLERLEICTSLSEQNSNISEINNILTALKDHLTNPSIKTRLLSNKQIIEQKLPTIFNHFCKISINFSATLSNYSLFMSVTIYMWNMIHSTLGGSIEKELLSAKDFYSTAMDGLNKNEFCNYLNGNEVDNIFKFYVRIFLKLAKIAVWSDGRQMEYLNLSDYTVHKCLHEEKYDIVFYKIISFVDYFFTDIMTDATRIDCITLIFSLIVTMSDNKNFLSMIIRIGFPAKLVEWLNMISQRNIPSDPLSSLIIAMSNIGQCEEGVIALNEACAITSLDTSQKALANQLEKSPHTLSFYPRIYAMIATTDQLKTMTVLEPAIDYLLIKIREADASTNLRSKTGHLYEYLVSLAKLLVNDKMAIYLLNNHEVGGLNFFIELFHKHNTILANDLFVKHLIRLALYNILCSLAFHQSVQQELKENQIFITAVMEASNLSISTNEVFIPSSLRNNLMTVKTAADGILVYLDKFKVPNLNNTNTINISIAKIPMISYSHKDANFCRAIVTALKERSVSVWIDEDGHCLSDDCWEEIALAIKNASMVLIIVSENYCTKSDSCRVEATYAIKLKIPIIALYIDDKYQAEPWLDIHLTGLYVKFGKKTFSERIARLATYITARNNSSESTATLQSLIGHSSHEVNIVSSVKQNNNLLKTKVPESIIEHSMPKTPPHTWSKVEVRTWWCTEKALVPQLCTFCDGEALCIYAQLFLSSYQENKLKHLQTLQERLKHLQTLQERLKHEHGIDFYDDHYANTVSSMMWIVKQNENVNRAVDKHLKSVACTLL